MFAYLAVAVTFLVVIDGAELKTRIKGGYTNSIQSHPYIVSLQISDQHFCGGTIISKDIVITAAHCVPASTQGLTVHVGSSYSRYSGSIHQVSNKIVHYGYRRIPTPTGLSLINDVALLKVTPPFVFNYDVAAIAMYNVGEEIAHGSTATLSGWGSVPQYEKRFSTSDDLTFNQLRSVDLAIVDKNVCRGLREIAGRQLNLGQICAYGVGKDACKGDSGGPLMVNGRLAGLVSHGPPCDEQNYYPGIYTEIAYFRQWIDKSMIKLTATY